ncbi:MAG: acetylglutamate kinase [Bacteroidales bacterium]|nr:acetylglutamate kinase [Bacteroidales bacterium]
MDKKIIVFKYGGNAMIDDDLKKKVLKNICSLKDRDFHVVIVHGGGPFIKQALIEAEIESEFIDGHRKTSSEAFEYVEMALKGKVNGKIVSMINALGYKAVGMSGKDGKTVVACKRIQEQMVNGAAQKVDLGQVGDVDLINSELILLLLENDFIPVITCLADDKAGNGFNINADMFAGHLAGALKASQFIVLTDVDGLLRERYDPTSIIRDLTLGATNQLLEDEIIQGGMIPKIESCEIAINKGAKEARIINGTVPEQILEVATDMQVGTVIHR